VQTFAGSGFSGLVDGVGQQTMFNNPQGVVADTTSNLFILDSGNSRIRKITPDGTVSTFAGGDFALSGLGGEKWTPFFGPRNAEIKLGFQVLLGLCFVAA
jgi:hypothetical protein